MAALVIEPFQNAGAWTAHGPDGMPSTAIGIEAGGPPRLPGLSGPSAALHADAGAGGHYLQRTGSAVDLTGFPDLLLWIRSDRPADGTPGQPLFLELRLGSAAMAVGAAGNDWQRMIPVQVGGDWQPVPLALADLPAAVRGAVTSIRLTCVDAAAGWTAQLDAVLAVRPELLVDVDAALRGRLDGRLSVSGNPVPAVLMPEPGPAAAPPLFRISNYDVRPDRSISPVDGPRTDYNGSSFVIRPPATVYQLDYAIEAIAADRGTAAALLGFALAELTPTCLLLGAGRVLSGEWIDAPATAAPPAVAPPADHPVVHLRVRAAQPGTGPGETAVPPFNQIELGVDSLDR